MRNLAMTNPKTNWTAQMTTYADWVYGQLIVEEEEGEKDALATGEEEEEDEEESDDEGDGIREGDFDDPNRRAARFRRALSNATEALAQPTRKALPLAQPTR